jgi:hypothetical protein
MSISDASASRATGSARPLAGRRRIILHDHRAALDHGEGFTQTFDPQSRVAELLAISQPKVSPIRNYKLRGISLERLMRALTALGQHVEIVVSPSTKGAPPRIDVAA